MEDFDYDKFVRNYTNFKTVEDLEVSTLPGYDEFWSTMREKVFYIYL